MSAFVTRSAEETRALGARLAAQLRPGDALMLEGDMGAGKSELARGVARGLGIGGYLPSPSFPIMQEYRAGRLPLYHYDWYRLESPDELYEIGLDEFLYGEGVALVEWPDRLPAAIPEKHLRVRITGNGDEPRTIELTSAGGFRALDEAALKGEA